MKRNYRFNNTFYDTATIKVKQKILTLKQLRSLHEKMLDRYGTDGLSRKQYIELSNSIIAKVARLQTSK